MNPNQESTQNLEASGSIVSIDESDCRNKSNCANTTLSVVMSNTSDKLNTINTMNTTDTANVINFIYNYYDYIGFILHYVYLLKTNDYDIVSTKEKQKIMGRFNIPGAPLKLIDIQPNTLIIETGDRSLMFNLDIDKDMQTNITMIENAQILEKSFV